MINEEHSFSVAIIGMEGRFPGSINLSGFWKNLVEGRDTSSLAIEGIDHFDFEFFAYSKKEAQLIDPQQRLFLESAYQLLYQAGYEPKKKRHFAGVFCALGFNQYLFHHLREQFSSARSASELALILHANAQDYLATRIAYQLNLTGPALNIQTACSSSLVAVHTACQNLLSYQCDLALAGGSALLLPGIEMNPEGGMLSPDRCCRAFDANANGTVFSSGCSMVLLKRYADALRDNDSIYAVIRGSAVNNDGAEKIGFTAPSLTGQAEVIQMALANAAVSPDTISYVETHGTGTTLGDYIEVSALTHAFGDHQQREMPCLLGSVKTNVGHSLVAAGITGLIKTVLAMMNQQLPASLHFNLPNPKIEFNKTCFKVNDALTKWNLDGEFPLRAGVSSFGIGGTNAHVILEAFGLSPLLYTPKNPPWSFNSEYCWVNTASLVVSQQSQLECTQDDPLIEILQDIWQEVLGVEKVGLDENFFDLGGHSLLATQVVGRINTLLETQIQIDEIYTLTTIRKWLDYLNIVLEKSI